MLAPVLREKWYLWRLEVGDEATRRFAASKLADIGSTVAIPALIAVPAFNAKCGLAMSALDRLAPEGMRFTDTRSGSGVCSPKADLRA